jgi:hypothetical protein
MLGLEATECGAASVETGVAASVDIEGAWEGTVSLALPLDVATRFAASMLGRTATSLSPVEVRDVIGELAHVVGGNVKGALPGPSSVSMPRVVTTSEPPPVSADASYWFECDGQPFCVTVHERRSNS